MYHTLTREVGAAGSMLNPVNVATSIAQGAYNDIKGGHVPLIHSMIAEPLETAADYYTRYAKASPDERVRMQSDMLDVAPEAIGTAGGMGVGGKLLETGGKVMRGAAPIEGAEGPTMPRSQILKNEVGTSTVDAVADAYAKRPFQEGGEEGVIRGGKPKRLGGTGGALAQNASGESAASLEDQGRLRSQQAQGLRMYDVDSRMANSKDAWHPLPAVAGRADQVAQPFHTIIQVGTDGTITPVSEGEGARPLPTDDQIHAMIAQPETSITPRQTPYEKAAQTTPEYRAGLQAKQISPRTRGDNPILGRAAMSDADVNAPTKVGANGETKLGYQDKMGLTLSKYDNEGLNHEGKTSADILNDTVDHYAGNLSALWDAIPDSIKRNAQKWYEASHGLTGEISRKTGVPHEKVAGVVSVFSPKNEWNNNLGNADRFIQRFQDSRGHAWTDAMDDKLTELRNMKRAGIPQSSEFKRALDFIRGKTYDEIQASPKYAASEPEKAAAALQAGKALWLRLVDEVEGSDQTPTYSPDGTVRGSQFHNWGSLGPMIKALQILEGDGSPASIGEAIGNGHKTRNFYNNIINPWSEDGHLTVDTHAVRAAHLKGFGGEEPEVVHNFGSSNKGTPQPPSNAPVDVKGTYPIHEEAYRNVAKEKGMRPNQAQSVLWEGIRSLFGEKPQEHAQAINDIWRQVGDGKMTAEQARQEIINAVGGFKKPEWMSQEEWDADESRAESFNFGGK
jgi:hypothetical protein